jgi:hypothetical protein
MTMKTTHGTRELQRVNENEPVLLDSTQAMERLGLTYRQLDRMRAMRRIAYQKRGGRIWYSAVEVGRVLQAFEVPALRPVVELPEVKRDK